MTHAYNIFALEEMRQGDRRKLEDSSGYLMRPYFSVLASPHKTEVHHRQNLPQTHIDSTSVGMLCVSVASAETVSDHLSLTVSRGPLLGLVAWRQRGGRSASPQHRVSLTLKCWWDVWVEVRGTVWEG